MPGQILDPETGFHYNYHRYYDPRTGRYLTPDPIGQYGGINLYSYVNANPINEIDPEGTFIQAIFNPVTVTAAIVGVGLAIYMHYNPPKVPNFDLVENSRDKVEPNERPWRRHGRWLVFVRCNVMQLRNCEGKCPPRMGGKAYGKTFSDAFSFAQMDANRNLGHHGFLGCQAKHCQPIVCYENGRERPCPKTGR